MLLVSPTRIASGPSEGLNDDPVISYCSALKSARLLMGSLYSGWTQDLSVVAVEFCHLRGFSQPPLAGSEVRKHSTLDRTLFLMNRPDIKCLADTVVLE